MHFWFLLATLGVCGEIFECVSVAGKRQYFEMEGDRSGKEHGYRSSCSPCETDFYESFEAVELPFTGANVLDFFLILQ